MADNASLARQLYEAWNGRNFDLLSDALAPDGQIVVMGSGDIYRGAGGSRQYNTMWADAFPDGAITVDRLTAAGDTVVVEFTGRGTHTGDLKTPMGTIAPTGRPITLQLCDVIDFQDGKIASQRTYFDAASLMAQLGLTGQPATTQRQ